MNYPSVLLEKAVDEFATLPGIGAKTALRLVLHLLRQDEAAVDSFAGALTRLRHEVRYCCHCHSICDGDECNICANPHRRHSIVCVVENIQDVLAIENTQQYNGVYHVLGGVISPMDGMGPQDIQIESLVQRVQQGGVDEVIFALSPTMEGDTTSFYIYRKLAPLNVPMSVIARGVAQNDPLQYADEVTLGRSIINRQPFDGKI